MSDPVLFLALLWQVILVPGCLRRGARDARRFRADHTLHPVYRALTLPILGLGPLLLIPLIVIPAQLLISGLASALAGAAWAISPAEPLAIGLALFIPATLLLARLILVVAEWADREGADRGGTDREEQGRQRPGRKREARVWPATHPVYTRNWARNWTRNWRNRQAG